MPGKGVTFPSQVNFIACLREEQVDPFDPVNSAHECSDCLNQHLSML